MRAVLCREFGPPSSLVVEDVPSPEPGPGQVVVTVKACGVNFPDTLMIEGRYQFKPPMPFSPGGEVAGVVARVGEGVTSVRPGDRVIAVTGYGGFAEEVVTDAERLVPLPDGMDFPAGSALLFTYGTAQYALRDRAALKAGETLLVLGAAGGTGLAAVEVGSVIGARVIAVASSEEKLELCRERGAAETINYATEDLRTRIKDLTGGAGVDVAFDPVGGEHAEAAVRGMAWDGRYLVIGFVAGIPSVPLNLILLKSCSVIGVFWGAFVTRDPSRNRELLAELFGWHARGKIDPHISSDYPLERAADALNDLLERKALGKIVLVP
ncbi:MAG: NADPH:quinone oxidoreductase family protein [Actinomycetota bacterium]